MVRLIREKHQLITTPSQRRPVDTQHLLRGFFAKKENKPLGFTTNLMRKKEKERSQRSKVSSTAGVQTATPSGGACSVSERRHEGGLQTEMDSRPTNILSLTQINILNIRPTMTENLNLTDICS